MPDLRVAVSNKKILYTIFFLILFLCILTNSQISLYYAFSGLELWYTKMIPVLLPFMILSGIMIRFHLTESFITLLYPILNTFFHISKNACYVILMGFLCGFPMGAKIIAELFLLQKLNKREAEYLLAFCNNIGPVYFCGFVLPLLHKSLTLPYILGMYGIPFLYGIILRYTVYRDITYKHQNSNEYRSIEKNLLYEMDSAINSGIQSILSLGGYMILFNLINLLPHIILGNPPVLLAPLFEITGGIQLLKHRFPLYTLLLLPFGGLSCLAQTYSCIKNTTLSIAGYTLHKLLLTLLTIVYYFLWFLGSPSSFLK